MFEKKLHYKMYKAGKHWVFATIAVGIFGFASTTNVLADETGSSNEAQTEQALNINESVDTTADVSNVVKTTEAKDTTQDVNTALNEETTATENKNTATQTVNSSEQDTTTADDKNTLVDTAQVKTTENKYTQENVNGNWYLKDEQGNYLTGFQEIRDQNKTVYYNPDSKQMVYGQQNINGNWYLFNTFDGAMQTGLQYIRDQKKLAYYNEQGQMQYGTVEIDGQKYQADTFDGAIKGKGQTKIADNWYLFNNAGQVVDGWQWINNQGKTVYYSPKTAQMVHGQQNITGHWYLFDKTTGAMQRGFQNLKDYGDDKTVYYNQDGWMLYGQQKIENKWYNFDTFNGAMKTGFVKIPDQNKTVYYAPNGQMQYGWQWVDNATRYFDTFNGAMATGQKFITGHWYLFDNNGAMQRGFQNLKDYGDNKTVYYNQDGWMQYGWQWLDNATRYFDTYDGAMAIGQKKINDHWYLFDKNGAMQRGFQYLPEDKKVAYYNQDGWMLYGKQDISGKTYSFNTYNGALENMDGQQKLGDHWYLFNKGEVLTGFQEIKDQNKTVYYDPSTARMQYGWQTIANNKYYFDTYDGAMYTGSHLIDGVDYSFDDDGTLLPLTIQAYREMVAKEVADDIKKNYAQSIDYDWNNQNDNYLAFTLHDTAQLVARNNLAATSEAVQKNLVNNSLFTGTANIVWTKSYKDMHQAITQAANDFMTTFVPTIDLSKSAIGVGAKEMDDSINVAIIIFTPGKDDKPKEELADSALTANVSEVYTAPGVNTQAHDGLRSGDTISASELGNTFKVSPSLLNGVKGQKIGEQNLKLIFSSLPGNETGLEGQKLYKGIDGNDYHYVFWLNDTFAGQKVGKQEAFLAANKDAVYGDPLKVSYSATLTWGAPVEVSIGVTGVPTSQMTDEQIDLAYKTGTNTGLRYDAVTVKPIEGMTEDMIRGVDIGSYQSLINAGVKFYDFDGNEAPIYKVLKDAGVNWIRLRVWNDPYDVNNNTYAGGDCSEANVVQMAKDASKYGLKVLLDFHYSDFWADPAKQPLPKAWEDQTGDSLAKSVYNYTSKVLTDLKNTGVDVGMVQVGNEITNGVFGIYSNRDRGESYLNIWGNKEKVAQISRYLNAGSKAVRDVLPDAKVAIQLETPNVPKYTNIMNALRDNNVDYDILGTSYYPFWSTHDGNGWYDDVDMGWGANTPKSLEGIEKLAKQEYGKQVVVLETGWINNVRDSDGTGNSIGPDSEIQAYSHDPQGQVDAMADMYKALVAQGGLGGFWWEPAWIPVKAGWENWQFNKDASDKYGTGWASQYAVGYAPDSVMYYNGQPTWGGSTWDNVALFDDLGHPLQSLKMYNGFLHGYESPKAPEKSTSTLNFKVNKVWNSNNVALKDGIVEGSTLTASDMLEPLSAAANELLSGTGAFTQENLEKIASGLGGMTTALEGSKTYYADNGDAYHYVFWFTEGKTAEQKAWNFYNDNMNAKYGEPLVVNVEATVTWGAAKA
ncbi:glycosyl hydrolase 53 family protein [Ligilactobacillus murinus]|uniref:glycosyl hydrolase 53 family protein n=1 Tax=Ligilactobacillus murinus TaxID=1622 RepID=UPI0013BAEF30|nr:glycosyl hydrolase 53 family protein [Ligilactobacillus murinus]NEF85816.1 glycosyl hydrolase [Ligilactobacillus murinus]NEF94901.1 glycosyl hydrolase [Ligilactobacillus murinus]NEF97115.1 glycosyl hydrolase [Ligilactobacillus murinus]NEG03932.1 glycosyl hydrolase [Ligilactobacillus murinus]NEG06163.1 glycosyl hydrolase [Ligilactobacillus murinus]